MADMTLAEFLKQRERQLSNQVAAIKAQLTGLEIELSSVRQAMKLEGANIRPSFVASLAAQAAGQTNPSADVSSATIKDIVVSCLNSRDDGATPQEIIEYARDVYKREIQPDSLRPQLARMKDENIIRFSELAKVWHIMPPLDCRPMRVGEMAAIDRNLHSRRTRKLQTRLLKPMSRREILGEEEE